MTTHAKKQHYVPQCLLRGFSIAGKDRVYVFDKSRAISYPSAIRDVASENYFNEVDFGDFSVSFENRLELVEANAAPVIQRIVATEDLSGISLEDRASLIVFIAIQMVRTKAEREALDQTHDLLVGRLGGEANALRAGLPPKDKEMHKLSILYHLPETINTFGKPLAEKLIMLQRAPAKERFLIGDDPIVRDNSFPTRNGLGNLGISNQGIEIYLPLSPKLVLALMCPSILGVMEAARGSGSHFASFEAERFLHALQAGKPFLLTYTNIRRLNSMQIANATRFVMSDADDFSFARQMIKDQPSIAFPPKYVR